LVPIVEKNNEGIPEYVYISAKASSGLDILRRSIATLVASERVNVTLKLPPREGKMRGLLFDLHAVTEELVDELGNFSLTIDISLSDWRRIQQRLESNIEQYVVS
jgi:GTP-binding protein HflX